MVSSAAVSGHVFFRVHRPCLSTSSRIQQNSSCRSLELERRIVTTPSISIATMRRRAFAAGLDHLFAMLLASLFTTPLALMKTPLFWQMVSQLLWFFLYFFLFAAFFSCTPGKWLSKLRIVHCKDHTPPPLLSCFLREFPGRMACMWLSPLGYVTAHHKDCRGRTLSDLLAGTMVIQLPSWQWTKHSSLLHSPKA